MNYAGVRLSMIPRGYKALRPLHLFPAWPEVPMSYIRVLPRDLFNEANLLKCLGHLWITIEGRDGVQFDVADVDGGFEIVQDQADGSISVTNVPFSVRGKSCRLSRPLNSRQPWPLYLSIPDEPSFDSIPVFSSSGFLSLEFEALIDGRPAL